MPVAVHVENLGKEYAVYSANRPTTLKEALVRKFGELRPRERFRALHEVSFDVRQSEILGVIGANGAGKSTLLRLVGGVGRPDTGCVRTVGRVSALLELGAAFHPELTGRENVFVAGIVAGLERRQVRERFDRIVEFAGLAAFIDNPLRTYSSGMQLRLAFSVNIHTEPRVLLVDEVLAVGDMAFQKKCLQVVEQLRVDGCAIVLVSHDLQQIRSLCSQVLWLKQGRVAMQGDAETTIRHYEESMAVETAILTPGEWTEHTTPSGTVLRMNENRFGSMELEITSVRMSNADGSVASALRTGQGLTIALGYRARQPIRAPVFVVALDSASGTPVAEFSTARSQVEMPLLQGEGSVVLHIDRLDLAGGDYFLQVGAYPSDWSHTFDYHWRAHRLTVAATAADKGVLDPPHQWQAG